MRTKTNSYPTMSSVWPLDKSVHYHGLRDLTKRSQDMGNSCLLQGLSQKV